MNKKSPILFLLCFFVLVNALLAGCAALMPKNRTFPEFIAVITTKNDTLASLAGKYLKDPSKGWIIADFNAVETVTPGQRLVIPLTTEVTGGITTTSYQTVPVLVYHNFSKYTSDQTSITKSDFESQMKYLKDNGYRVISMNQFFDFLEYNTQIPGKSVVLTIDDGWRGVYDIAYPILRKYGYPATLFVCTDIITGSHKTLSWKQIREMMKHGIDIQNHGKTHRNFARKKPEESIETYFETIKNDVTAAHRKIKAKLGKDVQFIAYPYGDTNGLVIALLQHLGYKGAFTVNRGGNPFFVNKYRINRSVIFGTMDMQEFSENLTVRSRRALR